jgi:hypothetical protein
MVERLRELRLQCPDIYVVLYMVGLPVWFELVRLGPVICLLGVLIDVSLII